MVETYKPMTTLKQVKAWARENHLTIRRGRDLYGTSQHAIRYKGSPLIPFCDNWVFIEKANALRQWHEEHAPANFPAGLRAREE